jgi:hypothetical protein
VKREGVVEQDYETDEARFAAFVSVRRTQGSVGGVMWHPLLRADFVEDIVRYARGAGRFFVKLGFNAGKELTREQIRGICGQIVGPLVASSTGAWIYDQDPSAPFARFTPHVERDRGRYRLRQNDDVVSGFEDYWGGYEDVRGTVVFTVPWEKAAFGALMAAAEDPGFLTNLGATESRAAIRFARSTAAKSPDVIVFLLTANRGLERLHVFAHPDRIMHCVEVAFLRCNVTQRYRNMYGGKHV